MHTVEYVTKFEDSKWVIRSRKSKKDRQYNDHAKGQRTNKDQQNIAQKTKDRATRTPLKIGGKPMCFGRVSSVTPIVLLLDTTNII